MKRTLAYMKKRKSLAQTFPLFESEREEGSKGWIIMMRPFSDPASKDAFSEEEKENFRFLFKSGCSKGGSEERKRRAWDGTFAQLGGIYSVPCLTVAMFEYPAHA